MKIKYIFTILLTAIITLALFQNSEPILVKFLWMDFTVSKLVLIAAVFIVGLIVGLLWAGSGMKKEVAPTEKKELEEEDKDWLSDEK